MYERKPRCFSNPRRKSFPLSFNNCNNFLPGPGHPVKPPQSLIRRQALHEPHLFQCQDRPAPAAPSPAQTKGPFSGNRSPGLAYAHRPGTSTWPYARPNLTFPPVIDLQRLIFGTRIGSIARIRRIFCTPRKTSDRFFGHIDRFVDPKWSNGACFRTIRGVPQNRTYLRRRSRLMLPD